MPIEFSVKKESLKEVAQSMLEARRLGRSVESIGEALIPLANSEETLQLLSELVLAAQRIASSAQSIYNTIAKEALG